MFVPCDLVLNWLDQTRTHDLTWAKPIFSFLGLNSAFVSIEGFWQNDLWTHSQIQWLGETKLQNRRKTRQYRKAQRRKLKNHLFIRFCSNKNWETTYPYKRKWINELWYVDTSQRCHGKIYKTYCWATKQGTEQNVLCYSIYWAGPNICSDLSYHLTEKPEWTLWPTQQVHVFLNYILCIKVYTTINYTDSHSYLWGR